MFVFNQRSLKAFNEKTLFHYKRHATIMAVLLLVCGICCLIPINLQVFMQQVLCSWCAASILFTACFPRVKAVESQIYLCLFCYRMVAALGYCFLENPVIGMVIGNGFLLPVYSWRDFFVLPPASKCSAVRAMDGIFLSVF